MCKNYYNMLVYYTKVYYSIFMRDNKLYPLFSTHKHARTLKLTHTHVDFNTTFVVQHELIIVV